MAKMTKEKAIKLAGNQVELAKILGITKGAVSHWGEKIPRQREWQLRLIKPEWFTEEKK